MITVHWRFYRIPKSLFYLFKNGFAKCRLTLRSLTYNHFTDESYAADVCMEPLFWFVDNFTNALGPLFVVAVIGLTASVVAIAYWIGLPYWWERNHYICVILIVMGNWLLMNIAFHYYMAVVTPPGYPPENELITEAVSICKKCISPKPPRTHHCSVCKRCILKMDHHCPWLNNCVGYRNHRYFFLYIVYMMIGMMFVMIFGFDVFYTAVYLTAEDLEDPELEGLPVKLSHSGGIIPVADLMYLNTSTASVDLSSNHEGQLINPWRRRAIIYMALINVGAFVALGFLLLMHSQLISKGETCIESNINKAELLRFKNYKNPYNFGKLKNWNIFLGLVRERTFVKHVLLPSNHEPVGDGLTWHTIHDQDVEEWP